MLPVITEQPAPRNVFEAWRRAATREEESQMDDRDHGLANRLERLERTNRRLKVIGLVALGLIGMAATKDLYPDVIQAKRFQVVDAKGNVLMDLGKFGSKNHPNLVIYDAKGVVRAGIGIDAESDNSGTSAFDHNGTMRTSIGATETGPNKGNSGVSVYDKTGLTRAGVDIDVVNDFTGFFNLDANGRARLAAGTSLEATTPFYNLYDGNGTQRASMSVDYDTFGGEGLFFWDTDNVERASVDVDGEFLGVGGESLFFLNNTGHNNTDNSFVGGFYSFAGDGGHFFTNATDGTRTGDLPPM
jgi:hypothetical protein